jgi:ribosomal protein S3
MQNKEILNLLALRTTEAKFSNQYKGILFNFSGRLKGAQRARKMQLYHGRISTQTFNSSIKFSQRQIYTKCGTIGSSVFISR